MESVLSDVLQRVGQRLLLAYACFSRREVNQLCSVLCVKRAVERHIFRIVGMYLYGSKVGRISEHRLVHSRFAVYDKFRSGGQRQGGNCRIDKYASSACAYFQNFGGVFVVGLEYERNQRGCVPKRIVAYCFHRVGYVKLDYPRAGKSVIVDCDKIAHGVALAVLLEGDGNKLGAVVKHVFAD